MRTVRIDQKYRAVGLHPDQGNVYILAYVDNHDEAMAWAVAMLEELGEGAWRAIPARHRRPIHLP